MGTERDAFYLDGWGYDRVRAEKDVAEFWATTVRIAEREATSETEEALREEIQAQAEVIEAQDWQIEALQEERAELTAPKFEPPDSAPKAT